MKLQLFVLADYAEAHAGKFTLVGAGTHRLSFSSFPTSPAHLSVAVRLSFTPEESGQSHGISIAARSTSGRAIMDPLQLDVRPYGNIQGDTDEVVADFVCHLSNIVFPEPGEYVLELSDGTDTLGSLAFRVLSARVSVAPAWHANLREAFLAFQEGRLQKAESLLAEVTRAAPSLPAGHNNLGFVLLNQRRFDEALKHFREARRLNYEEPEILGVNMGCCLYGLQLWSDAKEEFAQCLQLPSPPPGGILCCIEEDEMFVLNLRSARDYVALVALNLAWCAFRLSQPDVSRDHAELAKRLAAEGSTVADSFVSSLERLNRLQTGDESI